MFPMYMRKTWMLRSPDPGEGGGGGATGQSDELPAHLVGKYVPLADVQSKYLPKADIEAGYVTKTHHDSVVSGTKGGYTEQINKLTTEKQSLFDQLATSTNEVTGLKAKVGEFEPKVAKVAELEAQIATLKPLNDRLALAMKYPAALDESTAQLVIHSTLPAEQLEATLKAMSEGRKAAPALDTKVPGKPPAAAASTAAELFAQAEEARMKGDYVTHQALMDKHWDALDAEKGKFQPPEQSVI